jgi:hypothetical protein
MGSLQPFVYRYRSIVLLMIVVAAISATIVSSCGSGGGGPDGGLCSQCGASDGPCQSSAFIVPGAGQPAPCPTPNGSIPAPGPTCVERGLICRRKSDSAQQRCFPADEAGTEVDFFFRCDGSRPGGTLVPPPVTPTATGATPTPAGTPVCGNGVLDPGEQCETNAIDPFNGQTCADFCQSSGGSLVCSSFCTLDFTLCFGPPCAVQ